MIRLIILLTIVASVAFGQDLAGTHLRIVTILSPPYIVTEENNTVGFLIDMLKEFQTNLGFTYEIYQVPDGEYGRLVDGQWTGLMGELITGNADMVLAPLTVTSSRSHHILFSAPWMQAGIIPLFKKPEPGQPLAFQSIKDLVSVPDLSYGAIANGGTYQFFKDNKYNLYKAMGEIMTNSSDDVMARSVTEAAAKVREGGYVFLGEQETLKWIVGDEPCDLMIVGKPINARSYGLGFPKGQEEMAAKFSREILKMKENGMFSIFQDTWWEDDCKEPKLCVCEANNEQTEGDSEETETQGDADEEDQSTEE